MAADWWLWTGKAAGSRKKVLAAKSLRCFLQVWCMEGGARGLDCPLVPSVLWESSLQLVDILRGETSIIPRAAPRHYNNLDRHQSLLPLTSTDHSLYCYYTEKNWQNCKLNFQCVPTRQHIINWLLYVGDVPVKEPINLVSHSINVKFDIMMWITARRNSIQKCFFNLKTVFLCVGQGGLCQVCQVSDWTMPDNYQLVLTPPWHPRDTPC